jgi:hypothetical protein
MSATIHFSLYCNDKVFGGGRVCVGSYATLDEAIKDIARERRAKAKTCSNYTVWANDQPFRSGEYGRRVHEEA